MITEDYVSYETAKLLKERGFVVPYDSFRGVYINGEFLRRDPGRGYLHNMGDEIIDVCSIQMAMKWLREVQALNIYARGVWKDVEVQYGDWEPVVVGYDWFVESLTDDTYSKMSKEQFLTYEEACEAAVKYCLEKLV